MSNDSSTDELFASLSGSLMKNLWADLQVGDNDDDGINFSLEQLERELAHLDDASGDYGSNVSNSFMSPFTSAASMVVSQQQTIPSMIITPTSSSGATGGLDAWQQSLEKFTAQSLEQDFLAAHSARKAHPSTPAMPPGFMENAEDYNVTEPIPPPPPGLGLPPGIQATPTTAQQSATTPVAVMTPAETASLELEEEDLAPEIPPREPLPKTPCNSMSVVNEDENINDLECDVNPRRNVHVPEPIHEEPKLEALGNDIPQHAHQVVQTQSLSLQSSVQPQVSTPSSWATAPPDVLPPPTMIMSPPAAQPQGIMIPATAMMIPSNGMMLGIPTPGMAPPQGIPNIPLQPMPMGIPVPQMMKAAVPWQSPAPLLPALPQQRLYCTAHPAAPPFPASAIESSLMTSRDLAYVLHSMLKPVLQAGTSPFDYDIMWLQRHPGLKAATKESKLKSSKEEMKSRAEKTLLFMKEKSTLGHITKSDVTRPRALLAVSTMKLTEEGESQQARASLWKARLYIDQGQQAVTTLIHIWQSNAPGTVPKQIQPHLMKLFRVLGLSFRDDLYSMDSNKDSLAVILKLSKGKTFVTRILDRALLPPHAVQVLIPAILTNCFSSSPSSGSNNSKPHSSATEAADARLFQAITHVFRTLSPWQPESLLNCLKASNSPHALTSPSRLECVATLLERGNDIQDMNFVPKWKEGEAELMKLLH